MSILCGVIAEVPAGSAIEVVAAFWKMKRSDSLATVRTRKPPSKASVVQFAGSELDDLRYFVSTTWVTELQYDNLEIPVSDKPNRARVKWKSPLDFAFRGSLCIRQYIFRFE